MEHEDTKGPSSPQGADTHKRTRAPTITPDPHTAKVQRTQPDGVFAVPDASPRLSTRVPAETTLRRTASSTSSTSDHPLSAEELAESMANHPVLKAAFEKYDTNKSGSIDTTELANIFKDLKWPCSGDMLQQALAFLDSDNSGSIEWAEFLKWTEFGWQYHVLKGAQELPGSKRGPDGKPELECLKYVN